MEPGGEVLGELVAVARAAGLLREGGAIRRGEAHEQPASEDLEEPAAIDVEPVKARRLVLRELEVDVHVDVARGCSLRGALSRGGLDGRDDPRVRAAAADVARERADDVLGARLRVRLQERDAGDDHPGRAVAALEGLGLEKRVLHRMEPAVLGEAFDRHDLLARRLGDRRLAGGRRLAVEQDHAGAALPLAAAVLRAGQVQAVAEDPEEHFLGRGGDPVRLTVDVQVQDGIRGDSMPRGRATRALDDYVITDISSGRPMREKPLAWLSGEIKTPPFSSEARVEAGSC